MNPASTTARVCTELRCLPCPTACRSRQATALERLDENTSALAVALTPADLRDIDGAAAKITVHGARYPESLERLTGR